MKFIETENIYNTTATSFSKTFVIMATMYVESLEGDMKNKNLRVIRLWLF